MRPPGAASPSGKSIQVVGIPLAAMTILLVSHNVVHQQCRQAYGISICVDRIEDNAPSLGEGMNTNYNYKKAVLSQGNCAMPL